MSTKLCKAIKDFKENDNKTELSLLDLSIQTIQEIPDLCKYLI